MNLLRTLSVLSSAAVLAACATPPGQAPAAPVAQAAPKEVARPAVRPAPVRSAMRMPTGTYRCELNRQVTIRSITPDQSLAVLNWNKRDYQMQAVGSRSGALRFEDKSSGLTWITVVGKSMLLDTKNGKQLANECRA